MTYLVETEGLVSLAGAPSAGNPPVKFCFGDKFVELSKAALAGRCICRSSGGTRKVR
jgi:hypothetical protein